MIHRPLTALGLIACLGQAAAAQMPGVAAGYNVYVGGLPIAAASMAIRLDGADYALQLVAEPRGLAALLDSWTFQATALGAIGDALEPRSYTTIDAESGEETETRTLTFLADGNTSLVEVPADDDPSESLPAEQLAGAVDPMSAIVALAHGVTIGAGCARTIAVWDGTRRYDMVFSDLGVGPVGSGQVGFSGQARHCRGQMVPVAGRWRRDGIWSRPEPGEDPRRRQIDMWLAAPIDGGPAVPVRMELMTEIGRAIAHLATARPLSPQG